MIRHGTVLLLGAGSSHPYGFPLGFELRDLIIALGLNHDEVARIGVHPDSARELSEIFDKSRLPSIDTFLSRRPEFLDVGKSLIASVLLRSEKLCLSHEFKPFRGEACHYSHIWAQISQQSWDELDLTRLKVVTFNYDRSFEIFVRRAMRATYGKSDIENEEKLRDLQVVHVYGSLGSLFESNAAYLPFGSDSLNHVNIDLAASQIHLIPEARDESADIELARDILRAGSFVAILGFGFDELNLRRINAWYSLAIAPKINADSRPVEREIYASCKNFTNKAVWKVAEVFGQKNSGISHPRNFINGTCLETLRETLVLGEWSGVH